VGREIKQKVDCRPSSSMSKDQEYDCELR